MARTIWGILADGQEAAVSANSEFEALLKGRELFAEAQCISAHRWGDKHIADAVKAGFQRGIPSNGNKMVAPTELRAVFNEIFA